MQRKPNSLPIIKANLSHRSFTIVEVLVAVSILAFVGVVLLKIASNNNFFIAQFLQKNTYYSFMSLIREKDKEDDKDTFLIKDLVEQKYKNIKKPLQDFIQGKKVKYQEEKIGSVVVFDFSGGDEDGLGDEDNNLADAKLEVDIIKKYLLSADNLNSPDQEKFSEYIYTIKESDEQEQE